MSFYDSFSDMSSFVISFTSNPKQDFGVFARGYTRAASVLSEHLLEKGNFSDYEAYPAVFLYRHAFELYLKAFYFNAVMISLFKKKPIVDCESIFKHHLQPLAEVFQKICVLLFKQDHDLLKLAEKASVFAKEFEQIDKSSYSYRYPIDTEGKASTNHHQVVNLRSLHNAMNEFLDQLDTVNFGFNIEKAEAQEIYEILQEAEIESTLENGQTR